MTEAIPVGSEFLVNTAANYEMEPSIAGLADGGFVVTWRTQDWTQDGSGTAIKAQLYDAAGSAAGSEFLVNTNTPDYQLQPTVTGLAGGGFVITWYTRDPAQDGSLDAIKAQLYDAAGSAVGGEFLVNTAAAGEQYTSSVTGLADGGFVITWVTTDPAQDGSGSAIKAQRYDAVGSAVGGEFLVNTAAADSQYEPAITGLADGGFVITWRTGDPAQDGSGTAIKAQLYDAVGSPAGSEFLVNTAAAGFQYEPVVTGLSSGGFVITWWTGDPAQDGSGSAIKAQLYDAVGSAVGSEFLVNTAAANSQYQPSVTGLANGGFVISWVTDDPAQDGSEYAIKAQLFDAAGGTVGNEFLVNTATASYQYLPTITGLAGGEFVVGWTDLSSGSSIKAQIFSPGFAPSITSDGGGDSASVDVVSGTAAATTVTATDANTGTTLAYSITGGADAALFQIDETSGALSFVNAPDFDAPADEGADNVYDVVVTASDGALTDSQTLAITVAPDYTIIDGTPGGDPLPGTSGDDLITGQGGDDTITSGGGRDTILGGAGSDLITIDAPLAAGSSIDGGSENDTLRVTLAAASLVAGGVDFVPLSSAALTGIETLEFASNAGETLRVLATPAQLAGLGELRGGAGTDLLLVSVTAPGSYTLKALELTDWTEGTDFVVLSASGTGTFTLAAEDHEGTYVLLGGSGNDLLEGSNGVESLVGNAGNDELYGNGGNDTLDGGAGADTIFGGAGDDQLTGGADADVFGPSVGHAAVTDFVVGTDRIDVSPVNITSFAQLQSYLGQSANGAVFSYLYNGSTLTLTLNGVDASSLTAADFVFADPNGTSTLPATENADELLGRAGNDSIDGLGGDDILRGFGGDDVLAGGGGNDTIQGGAGNDTISGTGMSELFGEDDDDTFIGPMSGYVFAKGGAGFNTLDYSQGTQAMLLQSNDSTRISGYLGLYGGQVLAAAEDISRVIGTAFGDTMRMANYGAALTLLGGDGSDSIEATSHDDIVTGGTGNDTINGGGGNDATVFTGNRADYAFTANADATITISDLRAGSPDGTDTLANVETIRFADGDLNIVMGDADANTLTGSNGDDLVIGLGGDDYFVPTQGNDILLGGDGDDRTFLPFWHTSTGVVVSLSDGTLQTAYGLKTLASIESAEIHGSYGSDTITGGSAGDDIFGGPGDEVIDGGAGEDDLRGHDGHDTIEGGDNADVIYGGFGPTNATPSGNDVLSGGGGDDQLHGEDGNDTLEGGAGVDTLCDVAWPVRGRPHHRLRTRRDTGNCRRPGGGCGLPADLFGRRHAS